MAGILSRIRRWISGDREPGDATYRPEIDCIVDTASVICRETTPSGEILPAYRTSLALIQAFWNKAAACRNKEALLFLLADHVREYPQESLRRMMVNFERKTRDIPADYRDPLLKAVHEEIFDTHHRLLTAAAYEGERPWRTDSLRTGFADYCRMLQRAAAIKAEEKGPALLSLHYALACYAMYVEDGPGHPVGTPFPGGLSVEQDGWVYYCPVRDHADDVPFALCPFCPAVQTTGVHLIRDPQERALIQKQGYIDNYFTNFKG
ncbi:DUF2115 domain-containing protein [Methanogenium sp. MK-MG]|uniref:DUF2115 domain-containing protein n=1 Tax=Methanogenium sp. MK-MG TaxID=2599926 RepID=UPI0013EC5C85|nr:DUF2115 domain-containing protein [Methanogenium sp. MK-MG]KAF1073646.1 hypothetical protein MKMG_02102 [Methanogenium sp. MK-MG]